MAAVYFTIEGKAVPCPAEVEAKGGAAMQAWFEAERQKVRAGKSDLWKEAKPVKAGRPREPRFKRLAAEAAAVAAPEAKASTTAPAGEKPAPTTTEES